VAKKPQNRADTGSRDEKGRIKPGHALNPGGRPKKREDLKARCVAAVDDLVVEMWVREVETGGEDWVECSKLLAAYGYGKPVQAIEHSGEVTLGWAQLVAEARTLRKPR
jgi:hypothetical protein